MNVADGENKDNAKQYLKTHKIGLILTGLGAIIGSGIGYYLWLIDLI
ncbi:hypothetical protein [Thomasclavelia sp.]